MAVPKRKMSRSNTRNRREVKIPRRLAKAYKLGLVED